MIEPDSPSPHPSQDPHATPDAGFTAPSGAERESFFAAVARHRRAAWRVTVASAVADILFALVVAVLMSPLFYALIALAFDVVNLVHTAPNVVTLINRVLDPVLNAHGKPIPVAVWGRIAFLAAIPGVIWMALVLLMLRRVLRLSGTFSGGELPARAPNPQVLAEQRFGNVVEEMALAASLPMPRVLIADDPGLNAAAFGADERHATIMVSAGLLARLSREQLQGIAAHLVGSIANGDMAIGLRAATTLSLFAFMARFSGLLRERGRGRMLMRVGLALLIPTPASARRLAEELADPMRAQDRATRDGPGEPPRPSGQLSWQDWVFMPLTGPVVITGLLSGLVQMVVLAPLVALAWRQRKYMADATAVRLTRDPDTLAGALQILDRTDTTTPFASWADHLAVASSGNSGRGRMGHSLVSMFPSMGRRLLTLQRMGAHVTYTPARGMPLWAWLIALPLGVVVGALMALVVFLLAYISIPLSALFLGIPFGILHSLLRWHSP